MDRVTGLTVFVKVVDSGGFSAASRPLNMSTTMVSKHIQSLEELLGVRLLNRTTRKVSLTEVGQDYYRRATQILSDLEHADEMATALQSTPRGLLRMYASTAIVPFIAPVVTDYLALYPRATIDLTIGEREIGLIDEGFDLAIRLTRPADSSLIVRSLVSWRHVLCAAPAYLATMDRPQTLSDLAKHNCICHELYPYQNDWHFTDRDGAVKTQKVSGNLVTNSGVMLHTAVLRSAGVGLVPDFMVAKDVKQGRLVRLLPDVTPVEFAMNAIYPHRHLVSAKIRSFIDLLVKHSADRHRMLDPVARLA